MQRWYALHVHSNCERKVAAALARSGIEYYSPECQAHHARRCAVTQIDAPRLRRPLFPGYVFAHIDVADRAPVTAIPQVVSILGFGSLPIAIDDREIESVRILASLPGQMTEVPFLDVGVRVRVRYGPLHGAEGIVTRHGKGARIVVSLSLLGRSVAADVDAGQLETLQGKILKAAA